MLNVMTGLRHSISNGARVLGPMCWNKAAQQRPPSLSLTSHQLKSKMGICSKKTDLTKRHMSTGGDYDNVHSKRASKIIVLTIGAGMTIKGLAWVKDKSDVMLLKFAHERLNELYEQGYFDQDKTEKSK